jgi:outer membrane lipoprotein-sorting protein
LDDARAIAEQVRISEGKRQAPESKFSHKNGQKTKMEYESPYSIFV